MKFKFASVILLSLLAAVTPCVAHLNLVPVAVAPSLCFGSMPIGDANHDGHPDVVGTTRNQDTAVFLEFTGNSWRAHKQYEWAALPAAIGDGNRDGKTDLVSGHRIFEALRPDTFPSESVWGFSSTHGYAFAQFTDLDQDSVPEVTFESNGGAGIMIFENRGDNQYAQVYSLDVEGAGTFAVDDFDRDGALDLAFGGGDGVVKLVECTGPDQYALVCSTRAGDDIENYYFACGNDMDHNGLPEFIYSAKPDSNPDVRRIRVCEEPVHGDIETVWSTSFPSGAMVEAVTAAGDVDGDRVDEFAVNTGSSIKLFKCIGLHQYEEEWEQPGGVSWLRFYDINSDGREELVTYSLFDSTRVYEDTDGLTALQFERLPKPQVMNTPATIVRAGSSVSFPNLGSNAEVAIYDIRGRTITRHRAIGAEAWRWDLTDQHGRPVPAGTYFVLIRCQGQTARTKLCVVN